MKAAILARMNQVLRYPSSRDFLQQAEPWLLKSEPENNLMFGVARRHRDDAPAKSDHYWGIVLQEQELAGTAFRTPPYPISLSNLPLEAIPALVDDVADMYSSLTGVNGPNAVATRFAELWSNRTGEAWKEKLRQRIHALTAVAELPGQPGGSLRQMEQADTETILEWLEGFVSEAQVLGTARQFAERYLEQRRFYLWEDNGPKSLAAATRESPNGVCISAVYTPPALRQQGYATATVSALSARLLASGKKFCCLYTDLANPVSNAIYAKIGYRPVRDDTVCVFG